MAARVVKVTVVRHTNRAKDPVTGAKLDAITGLGVEQAVRLSKVLNDGKLFDLYASGDSDRVQKVAGIIAGGLPVEPNPGFGYRHFGPEEQVVADWNAWVAVTGKSEEDLTGADMLEGYPAVQHIIETNLPALKDFACRLATVQVVNGVPHGLVVTHTGIYEIAVTNPAEQKLLGEGETIEFLLFADPASGWVQVQSCTHTRPLEGVPA